MFNKATENDAQDLKLLLSYMEAQDDVVQERKDELRDICLEFGINSPLLGDEFYDPNAPDLSREAQNFGDKISQICGSRNLFQHYMRNTRDMLEMSKTNRAEVDEERRRKFYILRYKLMLDEKGIDFFDSADLKKMLDLKVITRAAYKR